MTVMRRFSWTNHPQLPSPDPEVSPLPPIITEEPIRKIRGFYVYARDVDPALNGFGFAPDCDGCKAIVNGKKSVTRSLTCRLRVMEQAPHNSNIASRVKKSLAKEVEHHSRLLEEDFGPCLSRPPAEVAQPTNTHSAVQVGGLSASSGPSVPSTSPAAPQSRLGADVGIKSEVEFKTKEAGS